MRGLVQRWPLSGMAPDVLRQQFSHVPVRALTFSLSSNRWARAVPLALHGDTALRRAEA